MIDIPNYLLKNSPDNVKIPALGFGVAAMEPERLRPAILHALEAGYRFFDCAPEYGNEKEVGEILTASGYPRSELFISTKLEGRDHAYEKCIRACDYSLKNMGLDYLDCYLIHWPMPEQDLYLEAWHALEDLHDQGKVRVIGLSNFKQHHIEKVLQECRIKPMLNELEINPYYSQHDLQDYCKRNGIHVINWFPLGGPAIPLHPYELKDFRLLLEDPLLNELGQKYNKTPAQVALRWAVERGITPIPKSGNLKRIDENRRIFDFCLSSDEMIKLAALDHGRRLGPDPDLYNEMIDLSNY